MDTKSVVRCIYLVKLRKKSFSPLLWKWSYVWTAKYWGLTETQQDEVMQEYNGKRKLRGEYQTMVADASRTGT